MAEEVRPLLIFLAGAGGGTAASWLFDRLGAYAPLRRWALLHRPGNYAARTIAFLLYAKETAAFVVFGLGALISGGAGFALALLSGQPPSTAWAAFVAFLVSQVVYVINRHNRPPSWTSGYNQYRNAVTDAILSGRAREVPPSEPVMPQPSGPSRTIPPPHVLDAWLHDEANEKQE